ncbi:MAG: NAD-dependent epimerase/dehydratase family protein [Bacteroidia bacterium]|jgi:UDP-glucose 4-epimerase|nr:NAD-dependent epimerase/dehydratase family protein [Bacteroidia bacterium]
MTERVLITGVAGFIGSNLLDVLLAETNWHIDGIDNLSTGTKANIDHALGNARFQFIEGDLAQLTSLKPYTKVFHLAALPRIQPSFELVGEHITANVTRAMHLVELMIRENYFPRLVYSGSSAIYGTPQNIPTAEDEAVSCLSPYAFQKYEVEKYLELLATRYPLDYVTLRYFNPYGPRSFNPANSFNAYSSVVGIFLNRHRNRQPLLVTGDGTQRRDFVHVYDLALANLAAARHPERINTAFNVGFGSTLSVLELARMISADIEFIAKREGEADITFADTSKAQQILGWAPKHTLENYLQQELHRA